jgi:hypothetical protein
MLKNGLIAFGVAFASGLAFSFLNQLTHSPTETSFVLPTVLGTLTFFILQMRSGNRKETRADDSARQAALAAAVPPGQALLFVYREGFAGKAVGWNVSLDGVSLAQLRSPRFTCTTLRPGRHVLAVNLGLGGFAGTQNVPSETTFDVQAGEVAVFAAKSKMGALKTTLYFSRESDPRAGLQKLAKVPMVAAERTATAAA